MEGRGRWGRRVEEGAPGRCKNRVFQGMQKGAGPNAAMDKANRNKMFLQGDGAVRKGQADEKQHKNAYGNCLGGNPDAQKNYGCGGR